ncbi:Opioid growth factor receptor-like 2, partial [Homarus americanus]
LVVPHTSSSSLTPQQLQGIGWSHEAPQGGGEHSRQSISLDDSMSVDLHNATSSAENVDEDNLVTVSEERLAHSATHQQVSRHHVHHIISIEPEPYFWGVAVSPGTRSVAAPSLGTVKDGSLTLPPSPRVITSNGAQLVEVLEPHTYPGHPLFASHSDITTWRSHHDLTNQGFSDTHTPEDTRDNRQKTTDRDAVQHHTPSTGLLTVTSSARRKNSGHAEINNVGWHVEASTRQTSVKDNTSQAGVEDNTSQAGVEDNTSQAGVEDNTSQAGVEDNTSQAGVEDNTSQAGVEDNTSQAGVKDNTSQAGVEASTRQTSVDAWINQARGLTKQTGVEASITGSQVRQFPRGPITGGDDHTSSRPGRSSTPPQSYTNPVVIARHPLPSPGPLPRRGALSASQEDGENIQHAASWAQGHFSTRELAESPRRVVPHSRGSVRDSDNSQVGQQGVSTSSSVTQSYPQLNRPIPYDTARDHHPLLDEVLNKQLQAKSHPVFTGGHSQVVLASHLPHSRNTPGHEAELQPEQLPQPNFTSSIKVYISPESKTSNGKISTDSTPIHPGDHSKATGARSSYRRQYVKLNPLHVRPSNGGKPEALSSTPLAHPEHSNSSRTDLSQHVNPKRRRKRPTTRRPAGSPPAYESGGPVDPAQLILQQSHFHPAAPGRPPSGVIAQPAPVIPETLIGSTEAPPTSLFFVKNVTGNSDSRHPPSVVEPSVLQVSGTQDGQDLGPSPFFSGHPIQPPYVFTTARPASSPVRPASLLISSGSTTLPPITVPPPGYNPLLENFQRLDVVEVNNDRNSGGVHIPAPQFPYSLPPPSDFYPSASIQDYFAQSQSHAPVPSFLGSSSPEVSSQHTAASSLSSPVLRIPGAVPTRPPLRQPIIVSNNTVVNVHNTEHIIPFLGNNTTFGLLKQIAKLTVANSGEQTPTDHNTRPEVAATQKLNALLGGLEHIHSQNTSQGAQTMKLSSGISVPNPSIHVLPQQVLPATSPISPPQYPPSYQHPGLLGQGFPLTSVAATNPQTDVNNSPGPILAYLPGHLPQSNPQQLQYPQRPYPLRPYLQRPYLQRPLPQQFYPPFPGYENPYGHQFGGFGHHPPGSPNPEGQTLDPNMGENGGGASASVAASVTDKTSSASSEAEGSDGVVSSSTTVIRGGTSTSNNNFYRPRPGQDSGTSAASPFAAGSQRPGPRPSPTDVRRPRPRPPIIVDGYLNRTAVPQDVFPGAKNVNVQCSRRHGCPMFILRTRPDSPLPRDRNKNTHILDEAFEKRPGGNINIACDYQEGCPTYIINTTPAPLQTSTTPSPSQTSPTRAPSQPEASSSLSQNLPATLSDADLLDAVTLVLGLLNQTGGLDLSDEEGSLTGDFDYILRGAGIEGYDDLLAHTPGIVPPINPQNIRPGVQFVPHEAPVPTPSPLAQHIGLQNRPNFKVVRVPENTVLNPPSFSDLLDNKQSLQVNPLLTSEFGNTRDPTQNFLGQPGTYDLLKSQLVQAHLGSLQKTGLYVTRQAPLQGHNLQKGSLDDAHMGQVAATTPPSLAVILSLEQQKIPNEPPLVPQDPQEGHHHHTMMRQILAGALVTVPMATALLGALGAPAAIMAPIGLAIPALLTMGFMDVNSNSGGFGSHFRRHAHGHHHHHQNNNNQPTTSSTINREDNDNNKQDQKSGGGGDRRPSSSPNNGGGMVGAIRRAVGVLPMVASHLTSRMGLGRQRQRRSADQELTTSTYTTMTRSELSPETTQPSLTQEDEDVPTPSFLLELQQGTDAPSPPSLLQQQQEYFPASPLHLQQQQQEEVLISPSALQQDLDTLRNMTHYYSNLSSHNKNSSNSVRTPTPDEVKLHRKYLLTVLQKLKKINKEMKTSVGNSTAHQGGVLTKLQQDIVSPSAAVPPPQPDNYPEHSPESYEDAPLVSHDGSTSPVDQDLHLASSASKDQLPEDETNEKPVGVGVAVDRIGQPPLGNTDLQNLDVGAASLLLNQFQTQGQGLNLLPSAFLGRPPPLTTTTSPPASPPTLPPRFDLIYGLQTAPLPLASSVNAAPFPARPLPLASSVNTATSPIGPHQLGSSVNAASLPLHVIQQSEAMGSAAGFQGGLPPSLFSVALQSGAIVPQPGVVFPAQTANLPPSILFGDPSQFSDYSVFANALSNLESFTEPPNVFMVDGQDFQELDSLQLAGPPSLPFSTSEFQDDVVVQPATLILQNTDLATAITNFINNLVDAISQLITDLQTAFADNTGLALLLLLGLLLLPFLLQHLSEKHGGGGYGGGGYHRRVYSMQGRMMVTETLAQRVLENIEQLEATLGHPHPADLSTLSPSSPGLQPPLFGLSSPRVFPRDPRLQDPLPDFLGASPQQPQPLPPATASNFNYLSDESPEASLPQTMAGTHAVPHKIPHPVQSIPQPDLLENYLALVKAINVVKELNRVRQSPVLRQVSESDTRLTDVQVQEDSPDWLFLRNAAQDVSDAAPKFITAITSLFSNIATAGSNFGKDTVKAISTLFEDLGSAIDETPPILLLGLIPLMFLFITFLFSSSKHLSFGHPMMGGGYRGRALAESMHLDLDAAESMARLILGQIDSFEEKLPN